MPPVARISPPAPCVIRTTPAGLISIIADRQAGGGGGMPVVREEQALDVCHERLSPCAQSIVVLACEQHDRARSRYTGQRMRNTEAGIEKAQRAAAPCRHPARTSSRLERRTCTCIASVRAISAERRACLRSCCGRARRGCGRPEQQESAGTSLRFLDPEAHVTLLRKADSRWCTFFFHRIHFSANKSSGGKR